MCGQFVLKGSSRVRQGVTSSLGEQASIRIGRSKFNRDVKICCIKQQENNRCPLPVLPRNYQESFLFSFPATLLIRRNHILLKYLNYG